MCTRARACAGTRFSAGFILSRVNTVLTPLQPRQLPRTSLPNGTARFNRKRVPPPGARALLFLVVPLLFVWAGCGASRAHVREDRVPHEAQSQKFWDRCDETAPAIPDGFQHFVCGDARGKQWEVLLRPEPTK